MASEGKVSLDISIQSNETFPSIINKVPALGVLPSAGHQTARGIIEDCADLDVYISPPGQSLPEQLNNIRPLHSGTFESFGPVGQFAHCQTLLLAGEAECEAQWKTLRLVSNIPVRHKVGQTLGNVIKQLVARALHDLLRDGVHLGVHGELLVRLDVDHENTKVRPTQVEREKFANFFTLGQITDIGREAFNRGVLIAILA